MGEFPDSVVNAAWERAGGKCECTRATHSNHYGRNRGKELVWENRGREGRGKWETHHKVRDVPDTLSNCEILCWECHSQTL